MQHLLLHFILNHKSRMKETDPYCEEGGRHDWESLGYGDRQCAKCGVTDRTESEEDLDKRIYGPPEDLY